MSIEIWVPVLIAIITSATSYFLARHKGKSELEVSEKATRNEIEKMKESHKQELEKLEREFELKADYEERGAQTELIKEFMKSPEIQGKMMEGFLKQMK